MPRNPSGVMILPAGNPVIPGTLIESSWANPTMTDLANEITQSLPRSGAAPMLGPLVLARDGVLPKEATTVDQLNGAIAGSNNYLPAGAIQYFAMVAIPTGWLEANGAAVSRTTYANLFATIGTVFGAGNGTTTFNLPDLRGTFIRGFDNGRSIDPGRVFGTSQAGSNAVHSHGVSDPGHNHAASQPAHSHGVSDPGHAHSFLIGTTYNDDDSNVPGKGNPGVAPVWVGTSSSGTGVSIQASQPGVAVSASSSGVSVGASGGEARPVNLALVACIKAFGALQTDGLGTMAFQNRDAVNITGGAGVFGSLQCTKAPTAPNDVARLSDVGGVDSVLSSDIQVLAVDATDPLVPVLRPRTNVPWGMVKLNAAGQIPTSLMPVSDFNYQGPWSAAGGNTPSQAYPGATFHDGDTYQISVSGNLTLYGADGLPSMVTCPVGSTITYVTGSPTFPSAGWYYNPPSFVSVVYAASVINTPAGNIAATNVQAAINELDSEKAPKESPRFTGNAGLANSFFLSGRNAANTGDVPIVKVNANDVIEFGPGGYPAQFAGPITLPQYLNVTQPYGALQVGGVDVMRFGDDNSGQLAGFRNVLINGKLSINQRGVTIAAAAIGSYGPDRWKKVDASNMTQIVEDGNYEYSSVYTLSGIGVTTQQVTSPASGHWAIPSVPITATYIQLELGSIATPFENRPIGLELTLCQRYYYQAISSVATVATLYSPGFVQTAFVPFPVEMRAVPTVSLEIFTGTSLGVISTMYSDKTIKTGVSRIWNTSGGTAGSSGQITYPTLTASAEL